ncbi:MAG: hypothetical protein SO206_03715 [Bacilli bacterium]|nr:hypothetical protein [Bacilli bacterium]
MLKCHFFLTIDDDKFGCLASVHHFCLVVMHIYTLEHCRTKNYPSDIARYYL